MSLLTLFRSEVSDWIGNLPAAATAQGLALALTPIAGSRPEVVSYGDHVEINFSPDQEARVSEWLISQLRKEPGPVRVNAGGIASQVIARQYWPWIVGLTALGGLVGYAAAKGGK